MPWDKFHIHDWVQLVLQLGDGCTSRVSVHQCVGQLRTPQLASNRKCKTLPLNFQRVFYRSSMK